MSVLYDRIGTGYAGRRQPDDGFLLSFWSRPEAVLDPTARAATSGFAWLDPKVEEVAVQRLAGDLADGTWNARHGHLRALDSYDAGLRLVVATP